MLAPPHPSLSSAVRQARRNAVLQVGIVAILLALSYQAFEVVSSARAYVGGEGRWSKAQKDAVYRLLRYVASRDTAEYAAFLSALEVPAGDRIARQELERDHPDMTLVREGFLRGRNHPADVGRLAIFFRRFRQVSYVSQAIGYWSQGDSLIGRLAAVGTELHQEIAHRDGDPLVIARLMTQVHAINEELAALENDFSSTLSAGARWAARVAFSLILVAAALLLGLAGLSEWRAVSRFGRTEDALRASESRLQELVEQASFGIGATSIEGRLLRANTALARILGYPTAEALLAAEQLWPGLYRDPADRQRVCDHFAADGVERGEFELEMVRPDGAGILARVNARALRDSAGRIEGLEYFVEDVTSRRALETQLRQAQKMEAVGQLTGGIAHDFNNMLTVILSTARLVEEALPAEAEQGRADLAILCNTARRGGEMIRKLLAFSRTQQLEFRPYPMQELVRAATEVLRRVLPAHIEFRLELPSAPIYLRTDPAILEQMLLNLATNARDAMPDGGSMEIGVTYLTRRATGDGPWVVLAVKDTGIGMSPSTVDRLYEPFFTTKGSVRGSGLGMTMVYALASQHGGMVEVDSAPGRGTTVRLLFPAVSPVPVSAPVQDPSQVMGGNGTVLLVEDEELLRRAAQRLLEGHGFRVLPAENGEEALTLYFRARGEVDLVLTDVVMPRLGGRGLHDALRERGETVPFLFMSGYVAREESNGPGLPPGAAFLPKPWELEDLIRRVHEGVVSRRSVAVGGAI